MSEGELYRLQRAIERLMAGHREALGVIDQEVEDRESSAQETLAEVQDILEGATRMLGPSWRKGEHDERARRRTREAFAGRGREATRGVTN
jgi:hypothetical protein